MVVATTPARANVTSAGCSTGAPASSTTAPVTRPAARPPAQAMSPLRSRVGDCAATTAAVVIGAPGGAASGGYATASISPGEMLFTLPRPAGRAASEAALDLDDARLPGLSQDLVVLRVRVGVRAAV